MLTAVRVSPLSPYTQTWELSVLGQAQDKATEEKPPPPLWVAPLLILAWFGGMYIIFRRKAKD